MTEVIKNISMKNETGTDLVVDSIIGADAPYITVFQSTTGEEEVCEEKVKYGYFKDNMWYKDSDYKIMMEDWLFDAPEKVFYVDVNSNQVYIRSLTGGFVLKNNITTKSLPEVLNNGINAVRWTENNILGAKNFIPIPLTGEQTIGVAKYSFNNGVITITGGGSGQSIYTVLFDNIITEPCYFTIDFHTNTTPRSFTIPSYIRFRLVNQNGENLNYGSYFGTGRAIDGTTQIRIAPWVGTTEFVKGFRIEVDPNITFPSGGFEVSPMLRLASIQNRDFVPYTMTNSQITKKLPFALATRGTAYGYIKTDGSFAPFKTQAEITEAVAAAKREARQGNAVATQVLSGKTFVNQQCNNDNPIIVGGMADQSNWSSTVTADSPSVTIPKGYHDGTKAVSALVATQAVEITPSTTTQSVTKGSGGRFLSAVNIKAVKADPTTVTATTTTSSIESTDPTKFYNKVTINPTPSTSITITPTTAAQTRDYTTNGKFIKSVTVSAITTTNTTITVPCNSSSGVSIPNGYHVGSKAVPSAHTRSFNLPAKPTTSTAILLGDYHDYKFINAKDTLNKVYLYGANRDDSDDIGTPTQTPTVILWENSSPSTSQGKTPFDFDSDEIAETVYLPGGSVTYEQKAAFIRVKCLKIGSSTEECHYDLPCTFFLGGGNKVETIGMSEDVSVSSPVFRFRAIYLENNGPLYGSVSGYFSPCYRSGQSSAANGYLIPKSLEAYFPPYAV